MVKTSIKKKFDIVVITTVSFPIGMAGTNRIISYLNLLTQKGFLTNVFITRPIGQDYNELNNKTQGVFEGIHFKFANNTTRWPLEASKLKKVKIIFVGYIKTIEMLIVNRPSIVITYTCDVFGKLILLFFRYFLKYRLIFDETEYPRVLQRNSNWLKTKIDLLLYKKADGVIVISSELLRYYKTLGVKNLFFLPISVDISKFLKASENASTQKYFTYVGGSGGFIRDGVFDIVKAFDMFVADNPEFKLLIVGPYELNTSNTSDIIDYVNLHFLKDKVIFTGRRSTAEVPDILVNATGIVMAPPSDFNSGGFPFKLGEFLASGTPTICTDVSDISEYLNKDNSFLIKPGDIPGIYSAMEQIVANPENAKKIGKKGQKVAMEKFNLESYIVNLIKFIKLE